MSKILATLKAFMRILQAAQNISCSDSSLMLSITEITALQGIPLNSAKVELNLQPANATPVDINSMHLKICTVNPLCSKLHSDVLQQRSKSSTVQEHAHSLAALFFGAVLLDATFQSLTVGPSPANASATHFGEKAVKQCGGCRL